MNILLSLQQPELCVGVDPSREVLEAWGRSDTPDGLEGFASDFLESLPTSVRIVKPQSAYYERHGYRGIRVLEKLIAGLRGDGRAVILDAKRGDIPETNGAYADAYLRQGAPLEVDGLTLSPYLGITGLAPFFELAQINDKQLYVVLRSSNPEGWKLQDWNGGTANGIELWHQLLAEVSTFPRSVGLVVGATVSTGELSSVRGRSLLVPGSGAQGGNLQETANRWAGCNAAVNMSRSLLAPGVKGFSSRVADAQATLTPR